MSKVNWRKIRKELQKTPNGYVVAVSGGVDSMFALDFVKRSGVFFVAAHFNHHMRADSNIDQEFVEQYCLDNKIPLVIGHGKDITSEADAREQRYEFLRNVLTEYKYDDIITGHHFNDQIETIFLRLVRGLPHDSLTMKKRNGFSVYRPFLDVSREDILAECRKRHIPWIEDPSNENVDFERNQWRNVIIPMLMKKRNILESMKHGISIR